tara:strand:- start:1912 stop:2172 length:261 start_codon:yes stop_codon:yes gene_type:complete
MNTECEINKAFLQRVSEDEIVWHTLSAQKDARVLSALKSLNLSFANASCSAGGFEDTAITDIWTINELPNDQKELIIYTNVPPACF